MLGEVSSSTNNPEHQRLLNALRESELLRELAELLASSLDLDHILQVLAKRTTEACEVERCSVWLLNEPENVLIPTKYYISSPLLQRTDVKIADHIWQHTRISLDNPVIQRLLKKGMLVIDDLQAESAMQVTRKFLVRSVLLIVLKREGRPVGMMSLDDPDTIRTFSAEQQQLAYAISQQAAIAIDNARLYQQAQIERKRAEQLINRAQAIYEVALTVNTEENLPVVLQTAIEHLLRGLNADKGCIALLEKECLNPIIWCPEQKYDIERQALALALDNAPHCQQVASSGVPLFVSTRQATKTEKAWLQMLGMKNMLLVPLMAGMQKSASSDTKKELPPQKTRCVGMAFVSYDAPRSHPSKGHYAFAQDIAAQCALAVEKAGLLADIRQAAALATEKANTLDAVFQAMTEGITVISQDGRILIRNNAAAQFLHKPSNAEDHLQSFLQHHQVYTLHGQRMNPNEFPLLRALRGEPIRSERFVTYRENGQEQVVEVNATRLLDEHQQPSGIVCAFRDITEQLRIERRIRQALETMLHIAEAVSGMTDIQEILRSVLESTIKTLNCDRGVVQLYNAEQGSFSPLLSIGFEDDAESEWLTHPDIWQNAINSTHSFLKQIMEGHATVIEAEFCPSQSEPKRHVSVLAAPIIHNEQILGLIMLDPSPAESSETFLQQQPHEFSIWDMAVIEGIAQLTGMAIEQTRWQQEALEARTSEAAMREANTLKDEFLAITAHEFRTPLTIILAHSQVVLRKLRKMAQQEGFTALIESLEAIEQQTHQLTSIVNAFLEATQINRGQLTLQLADVDLAAIVSQTVAQASTATPTHPIHSTIIPGNYPYIVRGDKARLRQILTNLLQNAVKYSQPGSPISISLQQQLNSEQQPQAVVSVQDKGIGIPPEAHAHLFERFYRASNTKGSNARGMGLGLYLVAELLHLQGGSISVESSGIEGEGSCFIFTLPLEQPQPS